MWIIYKENRLKIRRKRTVCKLAPFFLFLLMGLQVHAFLHSDIATKKSQQTIQKMFGTSVDLVAFESNPNYYSIYQKDSLIAYYCVEQAPSKHDVFEFMVVYDPLLHIQKVQVLIYREDYGYEIKSRRWLQQFTKRKVDSVQAISGATISVNSLKNAVDRLNEKMASQLL